MHLDESEVIRQRFRDALEQALTQAIQPDGTAITSVFCDWFNRRCSGCGHTFREGDRVLVNRDSAGARRDVRHLDPLLGCAGGPGGGTEAGAITKRFHQAIDRALPPAGHLRRERLQPGDFLLRNEAGGRPDCLQCSDTFRPYELVVRCPCGELQCQKSLHRDPQRGLTCFDDRWPDLIVNYCPFRKRPVE